MTFKIMESRLSPDSKRMIRVRAGTHRSGGFTLMEVIVAVLIMGMALAALSTVLRTAVRAWHAGHGAAEIYQTARIVQDVVHRDLDNMVYLNASSYNKTFQHQLEMLIQKVQQSGGLGDSDHRRQRRESRQEDAKRTKSKAEQADDPYAGLDLSTMAPPIDLALHGSDGGRTDRISFVRGYLPRQEGEAVNWGIRRVSYYIRDKVLYRTQSDAFGLTSETDYGAQPAALPGALPSGGAGRAQEKQAAELAAIRQEALGLFYRPDSLEQDPASASQGVLPARTQVEEPLCEGVEIFDVTYGYFMGGQWVEAKDWDSRQSKYRTQSKGPHAASNLRRDPSAPVDPAEIENGLVVVNKSTDGLPGTLAIQFGVRKGKGKIHSFTIFYSLPEAQETDVNLSGEDIRIARSGRP